MLGIWPSIAERFPTARSRVTIYTIYNYVGHKNLTNVLDELAVSFRGQVYLIFFLEAL